MSDVSDAWGGTIPELKRRRETPVSEPQGQNHVLLDAWGMHELGKEKACYFLNSRLSFISLVPET